MPAPAPEAPPTDRTIRRDLAALAAASLALRLPASLAERHLTFDDGVFGASAVAMRAGAQPFREVFSSQGPLFLPLLWVADLVGLRRLDSPRVLSVAAGLVLVAAVYLAGRAIADRAGALLAAGLTSACASILWVTGPLAADGVALAFAAITICLLLRWRSDLTVPRAVWIGLAIGATVSVKSLVGAVILPVALVLLAAGRLRPILAGAASAIGFHLLLWLPWGVSDVWDQSYAYHLEVAGSRTPGANLKKILSTLGDRDLPLVAAGALALGAAILAARRRRADSDHRTGAAPAALLERLTSPDGLLLGWLALSVVVLLAEHPLWRPHISMLVVPGALLIARHRPPAIALALAAVVVVPYHVVHAWDLLRPDPYPDRTEQVVDLLRVLPPGALAISDDPGLVWRAGRRTTDDLVDTSILRIQTHRMDSDSVMAAAASRRVCAVVVRSAVRWGSFDDLPGRLLAAGYVVAAEDGPVRRAYVKSRCEASRFVER